MKTITPIMLVGGFLGAGKTTAIRALGKLLTRRGQTIAVITNDQYAKAEADMGWLNAKVSVQFPEPKDGNAFSVWVADIKAKEGGNAEISYLNAFRPSPPNPTYRYN